MKIEISEDRIDLAVEMMKNITGHAPEAYMDALSMGSKFRIEGLTPLYILDDMTNELIVTSRENFENKLN